MKKRLFGIVLVLFSFFVFQNVAYAATGSNQCTLVNDSKWKYSNNYHYSTTDESGEKDGKKIVCCSVKRGDSKFVCDEYTANTTKEASETDKTASPSTVTTGDIKVCSDQHLRPAYKFIGNIVRIAKIFIPIIIILFGIFDLFKSVTSAKPEEIAKSLKALMFRTIAGVIIFFLPVLITLIFGMVEDWQAQEGEAQSCINCIWDVKNC